MSKDFRGAFTDGSSLGLVMSNLSITFEISKPMSTHYVHIKDNAKYRNWSGLKHLGVNQDREIALLSSA